MIQAAGDPHRIIAEMEELSLSDYLPAPSTYGLIRRAAESHGTAPALTFLPTGDPDEPAPTLNYGEFLGRLHQTANLFHTLGVEKDGVVSTLLPHLPETHEVFWGAQAAGIINPINFLLRTEEIIELMNAAGSRVLVAAGPHPALGIWPKVEQLQSKVPTLKHVLQIPMAPGSSLDEAQSFQRLRDRQPADCLISGRNIEASDIAAYFHTGGTTGSPKLAQHSHRNEVFTAWTFSRLIGFGPSEVILNGLPMFHVAGTLICGLAALAAGSRLVILSPAGMRHPNVVKNYWRIAERFGATVLGGVPTSLAALNDVPMENEDLSRAELSITGASPLPLEVGRQFEQRTGLPLHQIMGMTETAGLVSFTPRGCAVDLTSAGYRLPFNRLEIRRWTDGSVGTDVCDANEPGMLVVDGPNVFSGYLSHEHNQGLFTSDGFLITGDLGYLDDNGRLYLTGRAKDVIIRGGHNIDPVWIESAAETHPDIHLTAAVGRPDPYAGEVPALFVTLREGAELSSEDIRAYVSERIAETPARPKEVFIIDDIPVTAVGKPFRPELRRLAAQAALRNALATCLPNPEEAVVVQLDAGGLTANIVAPKDGGDLDDIRRILDGFAVRYEIEA